MVLNFKVNIFAFEDVLQFGPRHFVPNHHHSVLQEAVSGGFSLYKLVTILYALFASIQDLETPSAYGMLDTLNLRIPVGEEGEVGAW